jgi:hypothetical protein
MCRLSLTDWLVNQLGEEHKNIIRRAVFAYSLDEKREADESLLKENLWEKFSAALRSVTVLDPACGSGSFLIGMLLVLDDLQARANSILGVEETHYERRKRIIGQSLYGVDVMEWAAHVAELRLWLQLVIETELEPAELKFRPLLPNLSFKVRRGDSLVQEVGGISFGLHREHLDISPALKGKLTALKGEKLKFFQGEYKQTERKRAEIEQEELRIFSQILNEKKIVLEKEIAKLTHKIQNPEGEQMEMLDNVGKASSFSTANRRKWEEQRAELAQELTHIHDALAALRESKTVPFVWDIAFVEIFESDKQGFDIVIGNPPYVRQEMIADPTLDPADFGGEKSDRWKKKKAEYKAKLQRSVYEAYHKFFGYNRTKGTVARKIDGKCDLYIFFYLHGLSLLNSQGSFCFITSNSWLDVGYGADLQEFLLNHCQIKYIIDNEAKRSFAQADVNTVICLFSAPVGRVADPTKGRLSESSYIARFVMFRVPFEQALSPIVFEEIDEVQERKRFPEFRVVAKSQSQLLDEGIEVDEEKVSMLEGSVGRRDSSTYNYAGDKWGGKYLRAPDIFYTILEKGKDKLVRLADIAEVNEGRPTGANDFFFVPKKLAREFGIESEFLHLGLMKTRGFNLFVISSENCDRYFLSVDLPRSQLKGTAVIQYIQYGEEQGLHKRNTFSNKAEWYRFKVRRPAELVAPCGLGATFFCAINEARAISSNSYTEFRLRASEELLPIWAILNSAVFWLQLELVGRSSLGGGMLKVDPIEYRHLALLKPPLLNHEAHRIRQALQALGKRKVMSIFDEIHQPDRRELDEVVFEVLGLTAGEREAVYEAVVSLVRARLEKAQSV